MTEMITLGLPPNQDSPQTVALLVSWGLLNTLDCILIREVNDTSRKLSLDTEHSNVPPSGSAPVSTRRIR